MTTNTPTRIEPKPGDVLYSSWGYDQTNVDFYRVLSVTPSGKSVRIRQLTTEITEDNGPNVQVVPGETFHPLYPKTYTKRVRHYSPERYSVKIESYANAYLWDGVPKRQTGAGWGH